MKEKIPLDQIRSDMEAYDRLSPEKRRQVRNSWTGGAVRNIPRLPIFVSIEKQMVKSAWGECFYDMGPHDFILGDRCPRFSRDLKPGEKRIFQPTKVHMDLDGRITSR